MSPRINELLKRCLGTDPHGGFQPIGFSARLRAVYAEADAEEQAFLQQVLGEDRSPNWATSSLAEETQLFENSLVERYPQLEAVVARALANRWAYGWK